MRWHDMGWTIHDAIGAACALAVLAGAWLWRTGHPTRRDNYRLGAALTLTALVAATIAGCQSSPDRYPKPHTTTGIVTAGRH